jgi:hypothetical protein
MVFMKDVFDLRTLDLRTWKTGVTEVTQCTDGLIAIDRGFENNKSKSSGIQKPLLCHLFVAFGNRMALEELHSLASSIHGSSLVN